MLWIEVNGKSGERILLTYEPVLECVKKVKGLGEIEDCNVVPTAVPTIKSIRISTKLFNCIVSGTVEEISRFKKEIHG